MNRPEPVDSHAVRRMIFVRPRFLGDVCLTLPTLDAARAACPAARIAYVVESASAPLLEHDPRIDTLIVVPGKPGPAETLALISRLRAFAPDVVLDFFCNPRTALWTFGTGARVRVGYPNKGWRSALYTHHARPRTLAATGFHLASLEALGWPVPAAPSTEATPRLHVRPETKAEARAALAALGVPERARLVGFHPGARWPTRRWAPEHFVALGARVLAEFADASLLVTAAGDDEAAVARRIVDALPAGRAHVVAGWPLARFVAMQSLCDAFVSGDTGPVHTSVAAGTPTLGLISRNRPAMFFPYPASLGHRAHYARVECSPCHRDVCDDLRCLTRLLPDGAFTLLSDMLRRPRPHVPPVGASIRRESA